MQQAQISSPGWIEIDLKQYAANLDSIWTAKPSHVGVAIVLKDNAYGHGAVELGRVAEKKGAALLVVATLGEALELWEAGLRSKILILGERHPAEVESCWKNDLAICAGSLNSLQMLNRSAGAAPGRGRVHLKIDSGMSRYGLRWSDISRLATEIASLKNLEIEGVLSHFAMSDEVDKSFAQLQLQRFTE